MAKIDQDIQADVGAETPKTTHAAADKPGATGSEPAVTTNDEQAQPSVFNRVVTRRNLLIGGGIGGAALAAWRLLGSDSNSASNKIPLDKKGQEIAPTLSPEQELDSWLKGWNDTVEPWTGVPYIGGINFDADQNNGVGVPEFMGEVMTLWQTKLRTIQTTTGNTLAGERYVQWLGDTQLILETPGGIVIVRNPIIYGWQSVDDRGYPSADAKDPVNINYVIVYPKSDGTWQGLNIVEDGVGWPTEEGTKLVGLLATKYEPTIYDGWANFNGDNSLTLYATETTTGHTQSIEGFSTVKEAAQAALKHRDYSRGPKYKPTNLWDITSEISKQA